MLLLPPTIVDYDFGRLCHVERQIVLNSPGCNMIE